MKFLVPLILYFLTCNIFYAQHISEFESLTPSDQNSNFYLPGTHSFQAVFNESNFLSSLGSMSVLWSKVNFDFTGFVPIEGSSKLGYLSINSETAPGGVVILDIEFDDILGKWQLDQSNAVDFPIDLFDRSNTFATISNCSGTVTPWGTVISCEETTSIETEVFCNDVNNANTFKCKYFGERDNNGDGYDDFGWAIEIDPASRTVIDYDIPKDGPDKLWALGNFKHENVVIHGNHRTVYQGADDTNGEGYLFKFVANVAQDLSSGKLYVYKETTGSTGEWILLDNSTKEQRNSTLEQCANPNVGATSFAGIEDVEISPVDGMVYFAVKGDGKVYRFLDSDPVSGTTVTNFDTFVGGMNYEVKPGVTEDWGAGNDNLLFDSLGNLWVAQDGGNNYIWLVEQGHTQLNPKVKIFARTPKYSEPTGLTFSPDERYIFMSIQHPEGRGSDQNDSDQTDTFGIPVSFNEDVVLVLARNEYLGKDEVLITQYYHDSEDSKWIEIKNISGIDLPADKYSVNRYNSSAGDISNADPIATQILPAMSKDEVLLLKNRPNPAQPNSNFIGKATQIESDVCNFSGDDVILITSTTGNGKYINVKDILGDINYSTWGQNKSFLRGGNSPEIPKKDFDPNEWFELDDLEEVNQANVKQNIALGSHVNGPAVWNGSWLNNSEPDRTRNAEIHSDYDGGTENLNVFDLKIISGASLTFDDNTLGNNNSLIVHRNLEVIDGGELIIGDTESLIIKNPSPIITGEIEKIEKSTPRTHINDITYWSSPVNNEQIGQVFSDVNPDRIFYFDQSKYVSDETYWDVWQKAESSMPMEVGKGYAAEGGPLAEGEQHEVRFKGTPNYGNIQTSDLYYNDDDGYDDTVDGPNDNKDNDFNLIGNPYPSAINIESFLKTNWMDNEVIDGAVYFWTHATEISNGEFSSSDYVTYNYVGGVAPFEDQEVKENIGSAQGFFVRALKADPVIFDPSMILVGANNQFFKSSSKKESIEKDRMWINLKGSDNSFKQVLIGFSEDASDNMDTGYDAIYLNGGTQLGLYSLLDERKLVIQGLGTFEDSKKIDLGFDVKSDGLTLTVEVDRTEGVLSEAEIILIDHQLQVMHDLKQNGYQFNYDSKGEYLDRFSIHFSSTILSNEDLNEPNKVHMYMKDGELFVDSPEKVDEIKIFDILGRQVISKKPASQVVQLNMDKIDTGSFFIVKIIGENKKNHTRKMIKF